MMTRISLLALAVFSLLSCTDEIDNLYPDPLDPSQATFYSGLFIEVVDTSGRPVHGASIKVSDRNGKTDYKGFLYLGDVKVGSSSYMVVEKEGYFHASRRFYPAAGQSQYLKIILLSSERIAFFTSSSGSTVKLEDDITLNFPANAYEFQNGETYE